MKSSNLVTKKSTLVAFVPWFLFHTSALSSTVHARATSSPHHLRGLDEERSTGDQGGTNGASPSCVSDGGQVGATWTSKPGEGASLADWITSGNYCCTKTCRSSDSEIIPGLTNETGYANCECGSWNSTNPTMSSSAKDGNSTTAVDEGTRSCVSNGGHVDFSFYLRIGEHASLGSQTNFCCSEQCEEAIGGSALVFEPLEDENGQPKLDENGEPMYEHWGDRFEDCTCGVPPVSASQNVVEGGEIGDFDEAPVSQQVGEFGHLPGP